MSVTVTVMYLVIYLYYNYVLYNCYIFVIYLFVIIKQHNINITHYNRCYI